MKVTRFKDKATGRWKWKADFTCAGERHRPVADTKEELDDEIDAVRRRARQRRYNLAVEHEPVTVRRLVAERVRDLDLTLRNHRTVKRVLESFSAHVGPHRLVESLSSADGVSFKRARGDEGRVKNGRDLRPHTVNRELEAVTACLRNAGRYFPSLETWRPPRMPYEPVPERGRERVISRDEDGRLLAKMREPRRRGETAGAWRTHLDVADMLELDLNVAMRIGEVQRLEKSWVDFEHEIVTLPAHVTKKKKSRAVPLNAGALDILRRRCASSRHPALVFTNLTGTGPISRTKVYRCLRREAARAQVPYGLYTEGGFTFHDGRHTAATEMLHGGADIATVGDVLGHSKTYMTLMYSHATIDSKRRAVAGIRPRRKGATAAGRRTPRLCDCPEVPVEILSRLRERGELCEQSARGRGRGVAVIKWGN